MGPVRNEGVRIVDGMKNAMKERPILFSAPMVRAILAGTKTQTRRIVKPHRNDDSFVLEDHGYGWWPYRSEDGESSVMSDGCEYRLPCPYGAIGDQLWVRETLEVVPNWGMLFYVASGPDEYKITDPRADALIEKYGDHYHANDGKRIPSIYMPRWASRITLEITNVRVERLQEISEEDAIAEGAKPYLLPVHPARESLRHVDGYAQLWEQINGPGSWDANPWVWVVCFRRVSP